MGNKMYSTIKSNRSFSLYSNSSFNWIRKLQSVGWSSGFMTCPSTASSYASAASEKTLNIKYRNLKTDVKHK